MKNRTSSEKIFDAVNVIIIILLCISVIMPLMNLIAVSFSSKASLTAGLVTLLPVDFTFEQFNYILGGEKFWTSFMVSLFITIIGTALSLLLVTPAAYTLSKSNLKYRKQILLMFVFTMLFSGGLVPMYILVKAIGLYDTIWVLILPSAMSVYNMILIKNFMESIPESLEESARIDGANDFIIFCKIYVPLAKPVLATIGLFFAVAYWNSYFPGLMYVTNVDLKPLQTYLYDLQHITGILTSLPPEQQAMYAGISDQGIQAASIIATTIPIIIVYPFLQKYFVKGIVVGSDK